VFDAAFSCRFARVEKEGEARQWLSSKWQAVVDLILASGKNEGR